jgi:hypothetical protein
MNWNRHTADIHGLPAARAAKLAAGFVVLALIVSACGAPTAPTDAVQQLDAQASADPGQGLDEAVATSEDAYPGGAATGGERAEELAGLADANAIDIVEDWSTYGSVDLVEDTITRNLGLGDNIMDLTLGPADVEGMPSGDVLIMAYEIGAPAPDDFVGFNRDLEAPDDWSAAKAAGLWIAAGEDPGVDFAFQFRESSGEVWRAQAAVPAGGSGSPVTLDLGADTFKWADWSTKENGRIDLSAIDQYGLYVGHQGSDKSGSVDIGPIVLLIR